MCKSLPGLSPFCIMKLNEQTTAKLAAALKTAKALEIAGVVLSEGMIRGVSKEIDTAIIGALDLGLPPDTQMGIGSVDSIIKRLTAFDKTTMDLTINERNDVSTINIVAGRSKMQFRCTSSKLIKYPKSSSDEPYAHIELSADEARQVAKAVNVMGSEYMTLQIKRDGEVRIEAVDPSTNDRFEIGVNGKAEFVDEVDSMVCTYLASNISKLFNSLDNTKPVSLTIGEGSSMMVRANGIAVYLFARVSDDDYGDD